MTLLARLPTVRGRYTENAELAPTTWFRVGGPAEVLFKPADLADLQHFLANCPTDVPVTIIGVASNLIIRDGGVDGVVVRLGREFATIEPDATDPTLLHVGAAALDGNAAMVAQKNGIGGLSFLSGIPGTIGAGVRMNAGCYNVEICDVLVTAQAVDRAGVLHTVTPEQMGMSYRHNDAPKDWIFVSATLRGVADAPENIAEQMAQIKAQREASQPIRERTGGSTFANPERDTPGAGSAWQAVDKAGCRGLKIGDAQMSEKHCNFMLNVGTAKAADLEALGEEVRQQVQTKLGINLRWEIQRIGKTL